MSTPDTTNTVHKKTGSKSSKKSQLLWFIGLYLAGLLAVTILTYLLRGLIKLV